jgi:hypothetical protein
MMLTASETVLAPLVVEAMPVAAVKPTAPLAADASDAVRQEAEALDCVFLRKPLKPLAVRSALARLLELNDTVRPLKGCVPF